jgi:hypothetical protein
MVSGNGWAILRGRVGSGMACLGKR